jgi:hypothetical protein
MDGPSTSDKANMEEGNEGLLLNAY